MSDDDRVIVHCVTLLAVVILVALGRDGIAAGLAAGAAMPSPVSTAARIVKARRAR